MTLTPLLRTLLLRAVVLAAETKGNKITLTPLLRTLLLLTVLLAAKTNPSGDEARERVRAANESGGHHESLSPSHFPPASTFSSCVFRVVPKLIQLIHVLFLAFL